eukprot:357251-Amphidinium_carterae.1
MDAVCHVSGPGARTDDTSHHGTPAEHGYPLVECIAVVPPNPALQKRQGEHTPHCGGQCVAQAAR